MTPEDRRKQQRDNQNYFSSKISELTRYMSFGICAVSYAVLSSDSTFATDLKASSMWLLLVTALSGSVAIILDYGQYICGWLAASIAAENKKGEYQRTELGAKLNSVQEVLFVIKQIFVGFGSIILITAVGSKVLGS